MIDVTTISSWVLGDVLRARAGEQPDAPFLTFEFGRTRSYGETLRESEEVAAGLAELGVRHGDRVIIMMDNRVEVILAWFACNLLGAVEVPINAARKGWGLQHEFNLCGAAVAVVEAKYLRTLLDSAHQLTRLRTVVVVDGGPADDLPWDHLEWQALKRAAESCPRVAVGHRDQASIIYTSGTTGPSKGVEATHAHAYLLGIQTVDRLKITQDDVYYVCMPLFHSNAQWVQVYASLIAGAHVHLVRRFSASGWLADVRRSGATVTSLLGVMSRFLLSQPPSELDRQHRLRRAVAIPMPADIARSFPQRFGIDAIESYGMTEISLVTWRPEGEASRPGSMGKPDGQLFDLALVDPETDELVPPGTAGEIVVRPKIPWIMTNGYCGAPAVTAEAFRNLWFHTGDAARVDSEGYWYFVDRIRDRIRRRGENISSFEVETVIGEYPGVNDCAVIGVPAAEGEDEVMAFVVAGSDLTASDLIEHCLPRLAYFAVPRYIDFVDELPKTPTGKVMKDQLRILGTRAGTWDRVREGVTVTRDAG